MYNKLENFLSSNKLKPYLDAEQDKEKAIELFVYNLNLSSELYKLLNIFELSTRNTFNMFLSRRYGYDWINRNDLLSGNNGKNTKLITDIENVKYNYGNNNANNFNKNDIIANLSLGFWVNLLSFDNNDKIWQPSLKKIFIGYDRVIIQEIFRDIKDIRNRIAHQETIFNKNVNNTKDSILFILKIYSEDLYNWILSIVNIKIFQELDNLYHQPCLEPMNKL